MKIPRIWSLYGRNNLIIQVSTKNGEKKLFFFNFIEACSFESIILGQPPRSLSENRSAKFSARVSFWPILKRTRKIGGQVNKLLM
jgi:hypothetical protein